MPPSEHAVAPVCLFPRPIGSVPQGNSETAGNFWLEASRGRLEEGGDIGAEPTESYLQQAPGYLCVVVRGGEEGRYYKLPWPNSSLLPVFLWPVN